MNHWSARRKRFIFLLVLFVLIVLVGVPTAFLFYDAPSCADGKMNGDESGLDCGGSCQRLCPAQSLPILSKGDVRVLEVLPGFFEAVAVVENPNPTGSVERARYSIKFFEQLGVAPLKVVEGETFVPRSSTFAIFVGPTNFGSSTPVRATLEWDQTSLVWEKDTTLPPNIAVRNVELTGLDVEPRVMGTLINNSLETAENVEAIALISDESGNIRAASRTFVESLAPGKSEPIIFSWPMPILTASSTAGVNIMWRVLPDISYIK